MGKEGLGYYLDTPLHLVGKSPKTKTKTKPLAAPREKKKITFGGKKLKAPDNKSKKVDEHTSGELNDIPYEFRQNDKTLTILVQVPSIRKDR